MTRAIGFRIRVCAPLYSCSVFIVVIAFVHTISSSNGRRHSGRSRCKDTCVDQTDFNGLKDILLPESKLIVHESVLFKGIRPSLDIVVKMVQVMLLDALILGSRVAVM